MKAMVLKQFCNLKENPTPLQLMDLSDPVPAANDILVQVAVYGVCHTELDIIEGRTPPHKRTWGGLGRRDGGETTRKVSLYY